MLGSGSQVGPYRILRTIGEGSMGAVYEARAHGESTVVALKILNRSMRDNRRAPELFQREWRAIKALDHPHIIRIQSASTGGPIPYIAMEMIDGPTLADHIRRNGPMGLDVVIQILGPIAAALDYMHRQKPPIIHCDVKPGNVKLSDRKGPVLIDFGIVQLADGNRESRGKQAGTPWYMSPEQASDHPPGAPSDQYALALVCYEMLAGRKLFCERDRERVQQMQRTRAPEYPAEWHPEITAAIAMALAKDPHKRYKSCTDFVTSLKRAGARSANGSDTSSRPTRADRPDAADGDRHPTPRHDRRGTISQEREQAPIGLPNGHRDGTPPIGRSALDGRPDGRPSFQHPGKSAAEAPILSKSSRLPPYKPSDGRGWREKLRDCLNGVDGSRQRDRNEPIQALPRDEGANLRPRTEPITKVRARQIYGFPHGLLPSEVPELDPRHWIPDGLRNTTMIFPLFIAITVVGLMYGVLVFPRHQFVATPLDLAHGTVKNEGFGSGEQLPIRSPAFHTTMQRDSRENGLLPRSSSAVIKVTADARNFAVTIRDGKSVRRLGGREIAQGVSVDADAPYTVELTDSRGVRVARWVDVRAALGTTKVLAPSADERANYLVRRGWWFDSHGQGKQAESDYRRALGQNPRSVDALLGIANVALLRHNYGGALQLFNRVLQIDPLNTTASRARAILSANRVKPKGSGDA